MIEYALAYITPVPDEGFGDTEPAISPKEPSDRNDSDSGAIAPEVPTDKPSGVTPETPIIENPDEPIGVTPETPIIDKPDKPIGVTPETPIIDKPDEPIGVTPETPIIENPDEPIGVTPETPIIDKPVVTIPSIPISDKPVKPVDTVPATPSGDKLVNPVDTVPETPIIDKPVNPVVTVPSAPISDKPVNPVKVTLEPAKVDKPVAPGAVISEPAKVDKPVESVGVTVETPTINKPVEAIASNEPAIADKPIKPVVVITEVPTNSKPVDKAVGTPDGLTNQPVQPSVVITEVVTNKPAVVTEDIITGDRASSEDVVSTNAVTSSKPADTTVAAKDILTGESKAIPASLTPAAPISPTKQTTSTSKPVSSAPPFNFPPSAQPLVGVIDTGFAANNIDIDSSRIRLGSDRVAGDANPLVQPGEGSEHGTHILGIIAATRNNGVGIDGINDKAPVWVGRAIGSGKWAESLVEFVNAARESGQPNAVVNLSLDLTQEDDKGNITTRYEFTPEERAAIEYARQNHVLIVAAAGNDGGVMSVLGQASQEFDNIITVGAAYRKDVPQNVAPAKAYDRADYSSYGKGMTLLADGGTAEKPVLSTAGDGVGTMAGTSVAAAKVTGAVSLVWAANPNLSYMQVIDILKKTATDLKTPNWDLETAAGLLNLPAAVMLAKVTEAEVYDPEAWVTPSTWSGDRKVKPEERAAQSGTSIATAKQQVGFFFSDDDKVDSAEPEKYYQFAVDNAGYIRWTVTRTNGSDQFPDVRLIKADGTPGRFKFTPFGGSVSISAGDAVSKTDGAFVDPGTYYLQVRGGWGNSVQNYNLSSQFIQDLAYVSGMPARFTIDPYFDFNKDSQSAALDGTPGSQLNASGQVEYNFNDPSKRIAKYGLEVAESGKLKLNLNSPNGKALLKVKKFIGFSDEAETLVNYTVDANSNEPLELNLNKGRYQIEVTTPFEVWEESDFVNGQTLQRPYTLTGAFSRLAPKPGEGSVPANAGAFLKTETSYATDTHYYENGYLTVTPSGQQTWHNYGAGQPGRAYVFKQGDSYRFDKQILHLPTLTVL